MNPARHSVRFYRKALGIGLTVFGVLTLADLLLMVVSMVGANEGPQTPFLAAAGFWPGLMRRATFELSELLFRDDPSECMEVAFYATVGIPFALFLAAFLICPRRGTAT